MGPQNQGIDLFSLPFFLQESFEVTFHVSPLFLFFIDETHIELDGGGAFTVRKELEVVFVVGNGHVVLAQGSSECTRMTKGLFYVFVLLVIGHIELVVSGRFGIDSDVAEQLSNGKQGSGGQGRTSLAVVEVSKGNQGLLGVFSAGIIDRSVEEGTVQKGGLGIGVFYLVVL